MRDKEERRNLRGFACFRCKKFYEALGLTGDASEICNECSRHRDNNEIPDTPPKFYDLDI